MITSLSSSALNLMSNAHHKASGAAKTIASIDTTSMTDLHNPIINLKEAEIESSAAVNLIKTEKEMLGSLFDAVA